jgi:molybdenum cofactor sulfurtransferase
MDTNPSVAVHLDAAGAPLPSRDLLRAVCDEMMSVNFGNPHSMGSGSGDVSLCRTEEARKRVLEHFGVSIDEYDVVFTSGTTASISIVGQSLPWSRESHICYPMNVHTSLLGLRCHSENIYCFPSSSLSHGQSKADSLNERSVDSSDKQPDHTGPEPTRINLLLIPGECNFTGTKTDLLHIGKLSSLSGRDLLEQLGANCVVTNAQGCSGRWLWLLDAAKLAATSVVDLSVIPKERRPHFVAMSFYKMFGYPTGLGALLVRRDIAPLLNKRYALP